MVNVLLRERGAADDAGHLDLVGMRGWQEFGLSSASRKALSHHFGFV
jgi:hypothetical protein